MINCLVHQMIQGKLLAAVPKTRLLHAYLVFQGPRSSLLFEVKVMEAHRQNLVRSGFIH